MMRSVMPVSIPTHACKPRSRATRAFRPRAALALCGCLVIHFAANVLPCAGAEALSADPQHVKAELIADAASIAPGATFQLAVRLVMEDGWHVNWLNPGDAGLAPGIAWKLPEGFRHGLVVWPFPARFNSGPLVIFGYGEEVILAAECRAPESLTPGDEVELSADISWLACEEACVPGSAVATLRLPVEAAARPDSGNARRIESARRSGPSPSGLWNVEARLEDDTRLVLDLQTAAESTPPLDGLFFFPYDQGIIENGSAQVSSVSAGPAGRVAYQLHIELARMSTGSPARLTGVLVSSRGWTDGGAPGAIEIDIPVHSR